MAKLVSKTTYARTVSEGINFSDLDNNEIITKEVLIQVLGIKDPGDLFTPKSYALTITGTADAAGTISLTDGAGTTVALSYANADTAAIIINKVIGQLATLKPGIYNYNINGSVLTISHIFSTPTSAEQFVALTSETVDSVTRVMTVSEGVALQTAYYIDPTDRRDIS